MKKNILALLIIIFIFSGIGAQEDGPAVSVTINPARPAAPPVVDTDNHFTFTLVINHPFLEEVTVTEPIFPLSITLNQLIKHPRSSPEGVQTVVEYRFTSADSGRVTLNAFIVETPEGITEAGPFHLNIRNPNPVQTIITPRLFWDSPPNQVTAGERITLTLRAADWNSPQPPPAFFMPEVPQGVILSAQRLSAEGREGGIVLQLTLIPLAPGDFSLPARTLEHENTRFNMPAMRIRVIGR